MPEGIVSASMGAMNTLLGKLTTLMGDGYKKLKGVRKQASFLRDELSAMKALLEKLGLMDELDPLAKNWRDHVREMTYDMENCIDDFVRNVGDVDANTGFIQRTTQFLKTLWAGEQISDQIEELKALAVEANDRRKRYKIDDCINSSPRVVPVDPRISAIYKEAAGLVGIDGPREEIVNWLTDAEKRVKVVSIVGFGGLGKTTLAKQVYDEIGGDFSCKAFVSVSQRPDMTSLLNGLQLKLGIGESFGVHEVRDIIDRIREHLKAKRYLIVVDDLWDQPAWNIIRCAFTEDDKRSRVIVTTRMDDVALWACHRDSECIYRMKPLQEQDSRKLFFNRIFGSEDGCPLRFKGVAAEILKKCGGLPLAIITIASLLASRQGRSMNEWESIRNSLGAKFAAKPSLEEMRSILNLSYMHLPLYLRACFLYLGMYPEDYEIERDDLVRRWIAEGFVTNQHGLDVNDVAEGYFNELINRSLIHPGITYYEKVSCKVHDMMLDLILSKCAEDNFSSVACNSKDMAKLQDCKYKVRRLLVNWSDGGVKPGTSVAACLSQVRSLAWFGESTYIPPFLRLKYLRVLVLHTPQDPINFPVRVDLTAISQLFQLRYLKVSGRTRVESPTEIRGLVHLETLELYGVQSIPTDIVQLPRLSHLVLWPITRLPEGIGNMKSLCTLYGQCSSKHFQSLGELTNLRDLQLYMPHLSNFEKGEVESLVSSIGKLRHLKQLCIDISIQDEDNLLASLSDPLRHIEVLKLNSWPITNVPKWIAGLDCLRRLDLHVRETTVDEVRVLGELCSLVHLWLWVQRIPKGGATMIGAGLFPVLENLELVTCTEDVTAFLGFEAGTVPKLRRLGLFFHGQDWAGAAPFGMEHLLALQELSVSIKSPGRELPGAEQVFRNALQVLPCRPSLAIFVDSGSV